MFRAFLLKEELRLLYQLDAPRPRAPTPRRVAHMGLQIETRGVRQARPHDPPPPRRHPRRHPPRTQQRAPRRPQQSHPPDQPQQLRIPLTRPPHRARLPLLLPHHHRPTKTRIHHPMTRSANNGTLQAARLRRSHARAGWARQPSTATFYSPPMAQPWEGRALGVPGVTVEATAGERLLTLISAGPARVRVEHRALRRACESANVLGEIRGAGVPQERVVIGAHYHTQLESPDAADNAAGLAALLGMRGRSRGCARTARSFSSPSPMRSSRAGSLPLRCTAPRRADGRDAQPRRAWAAGAREAQIVARVPRCASSRRRAPGGPAGRSRPSSTRASSPSPTTRHSSTLAFRPVGSGAIRRPTPTTTPPGTRYAGSTTV
jgi:hypothetical protein